MKCLLNLLSEALNYKRPFLSAFGKREMVFAETLMNGNYSNGDSKIISGPPPPAGRKAQSISIIHFNDVYNVEEQSREPLGGAARFKTALKSFSDRQPLILFSGDILAPSISKYFRINIVRNINYYL